jgi:anti-sigma factor RsiW
MNTPRSTHCPKHVPRRRAAPADAHSLIACYVCDALDRDERSSFEAHLTTCSACGEEVKQLREVAALLAYAVSAVPPKHLYTRVREAIAEAEARRPRRFSFKTRRFISTQSHRSRKTGQSRARKWN